MTTIVVSPKIERESFEKDKVNIDLIKRKTNSSTFRGYLMGLIAKAKKDKNKELEILFSEILVKFNKFYPQRIVKSEIEIVSGWKGTGNLEIYKGVTNSFICLEHIKDKETGEVTERRIEVKKEDLNKMIFIIKSLEINKPTSCYAIAELMGYTWKNLWKERNKYFAEYYWAIKILEALKVINYSGKGIITRLK